MRWALCIGCLVLIGCSGRGYSLVNVSGTVTMRGNTLAGASVTFVPLGNGVGPASAAITDENGLFLLQTVDKQERGAVPGLHRVTITTARASAADERAKVSKEKVPSKYRDGSFQFKVPEGGTVTANIDIESK